MYHRIRVTKRRWYQLGGFRNSKLFRLSNRCGGWLYYIAID